MPRYTCRESAERISPLIDAAKCAATAVFPTAVGPTIEIRSRFFMVRIKVTGLGAKLCQK